MVPARVEARIDSHLESVAGPSSGRGTRSLDHRAILESMNIRNRLVITGRDVYREVHIEAVTWRTSAQKLGHLISTNVLANLAVPLQNEVNLRIFRTD